MMIYLKINMKGRTNMNNENIRRFYEEVKESLDDNYKIIIESKEDLDEDWVEYDSVKWTVEQPIEKKVNELLNKKSSTLEEKILKLYEYICLNYVYDDNVLFFFRKDLSDHNNIKYIAVDWYGRIVGNEWEDNRQNHNRRVCYEFARVYAKAIKELLDDNNNLDVFMLGDKENLHYVVGLTGPEYSVILDLDDFNSIKDLTRLKLGLTIKGIRILRDNSGKFKDAINKFNVGRKSELAEIEALSSESDKKNFITYLNEIILILNKYNVDTQGFYEYMKLIIEAKKIETEKVWKKINEGSGNKLGIIRDYDDQLDAKKRHDKYNDDKEICVRTTEYYTLEPEIVNTGDNFNILKEKYGEVFGWSNMTAEQLTEAWKNAKASDMFTICKDLASGGLEGFQMPKHIQDVLDFLSQEQEEVL